MAGMEPSDAQAAHLAYVGNLGRDVGTVPTLYPARGSQDPQGAVFPPQGSRARDRRALRRDVPRPYGMVCLYYSFNLTVGSIT